MVDKVQEGKRVATFYDRETCVSSALNDLALQSLYPLVAKDSVGEYTTSAFAVRREPAYNT